MTERRHPTSLRFTHDELELLDAWAAYLGKRRARRVSRTEVVATLLRRAKEPAELSPEARAVRTVMRRAVKLEG